MNWHGGRPIFRKTRHCSYSGSSIIGGVTCNVYLIFPLGNESATKPLWPKWRSSHRSPLEEKGLTLSVKFGKLNFLTENLKACVVLEYIKNNFLECLVLGEGRQAIVPFDLLHHAKVGRIELPQRGEFCDSVKQSNLDWTQ
jgi:hypothetical protein